MCERRTGNAQSCTGGVRVATSARNVRFRFYTGRDAQWVCHSMSGHACIVTDPPISTDRVWLRRAPTGAAAFEVLRV
jgi:hypothetical protein